MFSVLRSGRGTLAVAIAAIAAFAITGCTDDPSTPTSAAPSIVVSESPSAPTPSSTSEREEFVPIYQDTLLERGWTPGAIVTGRSLLAPALKAVSPTGMELTPEARNKLGNDLSYSYSSETLRPWTHAKSPVTLYTVVNEPATVDTDGNVVVATTRLNNRIAYASVWFRPRYGEETPATNSDYNLLTDLRSIASLEGGPSKGVDMPNGRMVIVLAEA